MDVTEEAVRDICTDAVFERGERYLTESRIHEIHCIGTTVTAIVSGSRQYEVRVDLATDGFAPWCDCPYDGPGTCKHVVAVLLRCIDDPPPDEGDQLDAALDGADADELRAFLRDALATDTDLRGRFLARVGEPTRQSVDELRASIDRRFKETNPEYHVVFEPIDFTQWFDLANEYLEHLDNGAATKRIVYLADQLGIDLPARKELVASFTSGYSLLDPTRPDTGSTDSTYRLRINVEPAMLEPTES
ncbi:SWIM zinc finger family protein [Haloplanus salilacus]|uniref:SWIM zinc finger family protein n=1 Tax=Haloplanus salilacus TaxID=2949994 RepID=UPI0030D196E3